MIDPLEELLHIICQLSLMRESLFQVPLKHIADACRTEYAPHYLLRVSYCGVIW